LEKLEEDAGLRKGARGLILSADRIERELELLEAALDGAEYGGRLFSDHGRLVDVDLTVWSDAQIDRLTALGARTGQQLAQALRPYCSDREMLNVAQLIRAAYVSSRNPHGADAEAGAATVRRLRAELDPAAWRRLWPAPARGLIEAALLR
jgi:hypothetical protein